jgi:hypothetical protein
MNSLTTPETLKLFETFAKNEIEKYKLELISKYSSDKIEEINKKYPDYFNYDNIKYQIRLMKIDNQTDTNIDIKVNHKYKIDSPHLNHSLELFMVKYNDFFATVHTFHLPCVRSFYDGENVYLTPSCVTAHLTYMNLDYKYFAGSRDPIDIINKYRMRGFGTWLNNDEKKIYHTYTKIHPFWDSLYNLSSSSKKNSMGSLNLNHKVFQPRLYNIESYYDACPVDLDNGYTIKELYTYLTTDDLLKEISYRFNTMNYIEHNFLNSLQTINKFGYINPVQKWTIEAVYNIINSKINNI